MLSAIPIRGATARRGTDRNIQPGRFPYAQGPGWLDSLRTECSTLTPPGRVERSSGWWWEEDLPAVRDGSIPDYFWGNGQVYR